jgi:hypothetical protein
LWPSLFEVLHQYGFSDKFLDRLAVLLSSASKFGTAVDYAKGPLSLQLFVLAVDVLGRMVRRAVDLGIM